MSRTRTCLALLVITLISPVSGLRAADAVKLIPGDALGLVLVDGLKDLDAKLEKAGQNLNVPLPGIGLALEWVPGLGDQLDWNSPIALAVLKGPESGDSPVPVAYVPVTDFEAFVKVFNGELVDGIYRLTLPDGSGLAAERDGYALIVPDEQEVTLQTALKSTGGLAERLGDDLAWVEKRDVALLMTDAGISVFCAKANEGIELAQGVIRLQGKDEMGMADILNVYKNVFAVADQETELVAMGLDLPESGDVVLQIRKRFLPAGHIAQCLIVPESAPDMLAGLPDVSFVVAAGGRFTPAMGDLMMKYSVEVMKSAPKLYGISKEQARQMLESAEPMMAEMESLAMLFAVGTDDDSFYSRVLAVMTSKDTAKYMATYETYLKQFSGMVKSGTGIFSMDMESRAVEIDGCKGVEVSMEMPRTLLVDDPGAEAILKRMIGPDGKIRVFIVAADEHHVLIGYTDQKLVRKAVSALREGKSISHQASIEEAAEGLEDANLARGYLNPAGFVVFLNSMMATLGPELPAIELPPFPETPPVVWSASAHEATADAQIVVPAEMIKAGAIYGLQVRQMVEAEE